MQHGNWKQSKKKLSKESPSSTTETSDAYTLLSKHQQKLQKKSELPTINAGIKALEEEIKKIGNGRHMVRKKRTLTMEREKLLKQRDTIMEMDTLKYVHLTGFRKDTKRKSSNNSHSRIVVVSNDNTDESKDIIMEEVVTDMQLKNYSPPVYVSLTGKCPECNSVMQKLPTESVMACSQCGVSTSYLDSTTRSANHGDDRSYPSFSYKKINHFRDWLRSVQAKESTTIGQEILDKVMNKLHEMRYKPEDLNPRRIRDALKACKLRKYYENTVLIHSLLTGEEPPRFEPEIEHKMEEMFMQIAVPFEKAIQEVAPERRNFLSYSYVCFKFVQLIPNIDRRWLQSFALLKGRDKLHKQDLIWANICGQLGWTFHASV